ncbi:hypothetical protein AB1Y20_002499 [Prymnesium parvum]|uniref:Nucleotide-diphospho-sugar transferase domain-containing protein n=1 Tax=Prymnesium parvum TaxID=97485 RepID=A0AB34J9G4_PRYPA
MSAELLPASLWETPSPRPFTHFGADLEAPGALAAIAAQVAHRNQIILICGDGSAYASPTALNTVLQFYALKLHHVLYVSDSAAACATLRRGVPSLACVWSSSINATKPAADSVLIRKWWDMRFYFYNVRKRTLMRLSAELGYDVLQTDTDVAWFANPYPALQSGALRTHDLIVQADLPLANAGVLYAQRAAGPRGGEAAEGDAAAWVLRELYARIRLFSFHPEAVPRFVPWAQPPFFSNADEQTLLNDVLTSAIANATCYIFSTAIMESKMGGTRKNASFRWEHTPEAARRKELMALVRARDAERLILSPSCCAPAGYRICYGARASSKHEVLRWKLHSWELTRPGRPPNAARRSYYAKAPSWLFQHYTHMDAAAAHKPQPRASTALAFGNRSAGGAVRRSAVAGFNTFSGLPPSYMVHLAGLRMGAWHRRAVLRAHGWWHPAADALAAQQLRWGRRKGYLITPSDITRGTTRAELDTLMGNLVLLAALLGRVAVLPEALCDKLQLAKGETGQWKETRRRLGQSSPSPLL